MPQEPLYAAGDARFESITKVIERLMTTVGYASLYFVDSSDVVAYAAVFFGGAIVGFILALVGAYWTCAKPLEMQNPLNWEAIGSAKRVSFSQRFHLL